MKKIFLSITAALLCILCAACHQEQNDYRTQTIISLTTPDSIQAVQFQGTVSLTNLSNKVVYTSSSFNGSTLSFELFRGSYSLNAQGTLRYRNAAGIERVRYFRAAESYIEAVKRPTYLNVNIIFM